MLQYSTDGGTTWETFPDQGINALFFSTNKDSSCVTSVNPTTFAFTLYCTDNTKFASDGTGTYTVKLRYSAQWVKVEDQPVANTFATNNVNTFDVTINNKC